MLQAAVDVILFLYTLGYLVGVVTLCALLAFAALCALVVLIWFARSVLSAVMARCPLSQAEPTAGVAASPRGQREPRQRRAKRHARLRRPLVISQWSGVPPRPRREEPDHKDNRRPSR